MELLNDIQWFIKCEPKTAINKKTQQKLTKEELNTILFSGDKNKKVKIQFPLHDQFAFTVTREIKCPVTIKKMLKFIYKFYQEPINSQNIDNAFENMEEWQEEVLDRYDGDIQIISNIDVFTDTVDVDFCGLEDVTGEDGVTEYFVSLGPE
jgi:hypothetical protein